MTLFRRFLPFLIALLQGALFWFQLRHPLAYPWVGVFGVIALPLATVVIVWKRLPIRDAFERMLPSFILLASLAFALLLVEGPVATWTLLFLACATPLVSLELLFLLVYHPPRYPVNGLSHANVAYVPVAVWYVASTSNGLLIFLHVHALWHIALMITLGALLFRTTGHTGATAQEKSIWTPLGVVIGAHVGLLGLLLPVSMPMHGIIAALIMSAALRARRYLYEPRPSLRQAWIESFGALSFFIFTLATAKWL
ncbi:MAG: hypothetical protein WC787_00965 [Patescibacteria group bacterium]|jgi:hypothetical protein